MRIRKSAEHRKAEIVQATLSLAFEEGPDRVTTAMIADRLGLSQPAIYKHFPRKDDIWRAVSKDLSTQIAANISDAAGQAVTPIERLRLLVLGHLRLVHATPALPEIMVARDPKGVQTTVRKDIKSSMSELFSTLTKTVENGQADGTFRADIKAKDLAALISGVIQSLVLRMLVTRDPAVLLVDGERLLDLQLSAFERQGDNT